MNKPLFTYDDFIGVVEFDIQAEACADIANAIIAALLEAAPTVYGYGEAPGESSLWSMNKNQSIMTKDPTHSAKLLFITEVPKVPCKHSPAFSNAFSNPFDGAYKCRYCDAELVVTWNVKGVKAWGVG